MFTGRAKVVVDGEDMILSTVSPFIQDTDMPVWLEEKVVCDVCNREYVDWMLDDPGNEPPMNVCGKPDCHLGYSGSTDQ